LQRVLFLQIPRSFLGKNQIDILYQYSFYYYLEQLAGEVKRNEFLTKNSEFTLTRFTDTITEEIEKRVGLETGTVLL